MYLLVLFVAIASDAYAFALLGAFAFVVQVVCCM